MTLNLHERFSKLRVFCIILSFLPLSTISTANSTNTTNNDVISISPSLIPQAMPSPVLLATGSNQTNFTPPDSKQSNIITSPTTHIASQSFIQSYYGPPTLAYMTGDQISSYVNKLESITSSYAIGEPLVNTTTKFISQNLYIIDAEYPTEPDDSFQCDPNVDEDCCKTMIPPSYTPPDDSTCWQWWTPPPAGSLKPIMSSPPPKGCDYQPCQDAVCACDSYCCDTAWDLSCSGQITNKNYFVDGCSARILCCKPEPKLSTITNDTSPLPIVLSSGKNTKELRVKFSMTWNSSSISINGTGYAYNFTAYMNALETKIETIASLNQIGVHALYARDVRITVNGPTFAPTVTPTAQPTYDTKNVDRTTHIMIAFIVIGIVVGSGIGFCIVKVKSDGGDEVVAKQETNDSKSIIIPITNDNPNSTISTTVTIQPTTINKYSTQQTDSHNSYLYNPNKNTKSLLHASSLFLLKQDSDELNYYKNPLLEKFKYKLHTHLTLFNNNKYVFENDGTIVSHAITNVLLMNENDYIHVLKTIGCVMDRNGTDVVSINEFEIEANVMYKSYDWVKRHSTTTDENKTRDYIVEHVLQPIIICILYKTLSVNASIRIVYECCTIILKKDLLKSIDETTKYDKSLVQNNNKTILITGMRKNVNIHDVITRFQNFGGTSGIDCIALASLSRDFGFVRFMNDTPCIMIVQKFRSSEILVQDVAVVVKLLSSYAFVTSLPTKSNGAEFSKHVTSSPRDVGTNDTIMHIVSENCSSSMGSLVKQKCCSIRNISDGSNTSHASYKSLLHRSASWPNTKDSLMDDANDGDDLFEDNQGNYHNDNEDRYVHLMRQLSSLNPYI